MTSNREMSTIGDNSIIASGSIVLANVPSNCVVVGIPGRIIYQDGKKIDEINNLDSITAKLFELEDRLNYINIHSSQSKA